MVYLRSVELRNFRSVGEMPATIQFGRKVTVLVGPNNSGKSNILRAIELALSAPQDGEGQCREDGMHRGVSKENSMAEQQHGTKQTLIEVRYDLDTDEKQNIVRSLCTSLLPLSDDIRLLKVFPDGEKTIEKRRQLERSVEEAVSFLLKQPLWVTASVKIGSGGKPVISRTRPNSCLIPSPANHESMTRGLRELEEKFRPLEPIVNSVAALLAKESREVRSLMLYPGYPLPHVTMFSDVAVPDNPEDYIALANLRRATPSPDHVRHFVLMMKEDESVDKKQKSFSTMADMIRTAFPDVRGIDARIDSEHAFVDLLVSKVGGAFELGSQGDGFKHVIKMLSLLGAYTGDVILIDEPEAYLHPDLESKLIDFFLKFGKGQLVIATHSSVLVNSIRSQSLEDGEVRLYGLSQTAEGNTVVEDAQTSGIIILIEKLGMVVDRYLKHMAAHAQMLVFVEGETDARYIKEIVQKLGITERLDALRPYFIPYGGKSRYWGIVPSIIDQSAKADPSIQTEPIPMLIVCDRDESPLQQTDPHRFMFSAREIENLVLSKDSITGVAAKFMENLGIKSEDANMHLFEDKLVEELKSYVPKWSLLKLIASLDPPRHPWRDSMGICSWSEAENKVSEMKQRLESYREKAHASLSREKLREIGNNIEQDCFKDSGTEIDYPFLAKEVPGKDFISHILRKALVETACQISDTHDRGRLDGMAGSFCNFDALLAETEELPKDIDLLLRRMEEMRMTNPHTPA